MIIQEMAEKANAAGIRLAATDGALRDKALGVIATALWENRSEIVTANQRDLDNAQAEHLSAPLLKRLKFDESKILETCQGLESLRRLPDPVGNIVMRAGTGPGPGALQGQLSHRCHRCHLRIPAGCPGADLFPLPEKRKCRSAKRRQ